MNPIRVLHFVSSTRVDSGVMSIIMNIYRNIDREKEYNLIFYILIIMIIPSKAK